MEPVSHIINLPMTTGTVPTLFKRALVVLLFKKGSKLEVGNYRPVSVLSSLSKILERSVYWQLKEYLDRRDLIYRNQSGFRGGFSTDTCLLGLSDYMKCEIGKGKYVGMVLLDLQKAFDTVDHDIMLWKLKAIGVSSTEWFSSYLSGRQQTVSISGSQSCFLDIACGVPQGSILGPLLFLIYVNDMVISVSCKLALYADDSALIFSHRDSTVIADTLTRELGSCSQWLLDNKLSLHVGKTECLIFGSTKRLSKVNDFYVDCNGSPIKRVNTVKYLGALLGENLSGRAQAENVLKSYTSRLLFLYRKAAFLDFNCRKILVSALIQPYFDYCVSSWYGGLSKHMKAKLEVLQRRLLRFIFSKGPRDHVGSSELKQLNWLSVPDRVKYFSLVHVFKIRLGKAPGYLSDYFVPVKSVHGIGTRGMAHNYQVSKDLSTAPTSFAFTSIKSWNALPISLKSESSLPLFSKRLKELLMSEY